MEKYEKAEMEVVNFEAEDVITTSVCPTNTFNIQDNGCGGQVMEEEEW